MTVPAYVTEYRERAAALRVSTERGVEPEALEDVYTRWTHPDLVMPRLWAFPCVRGFDTGWDQWMRTTITCEHGHFSGVSDGFDNPIGQSLAHAFAAFDAADHRVCRDESHRDDDNLTEKCTVCGLDELMW